MGFDKLEYFSAVRPEMPQTLTITGDGSARYVSCTNAEMPDRPEVGAYAMTLPPDEMRMLQDALAKPLFDDWSDHWGRVLSGDRYRRVRVTTGSGAVDKIVGTAEPIVPPLSAFLKRLDQIVAQAMQHPVQVLRLGVGQAQVGGDGKLAVTFSLTNTGTQTLFCRNPGNLLEAPDGQLVVKMWPDKPLSRLTAEEILAPTVSAVQETGREGGAESSSAVLEIPPKASVRFRIEAPLDLKLSGGYALRVTYFNTLARTRLGRDLLQAELLSAVQKVQMTQPGPARP